MVGRRHSLECECDVALFVKKFVLELFLLFQLNTYFIGILSILLAIDFVLVEAIILLTEIHLSAHFYVWGCVCWL